MSTDGLPLHLQGDQLTPYDSATREPSDPPVRFIERGGKAAQTRSPLSEKNDSTEEYRVGPSQFDQSPIAPPSVNPSRLPDPFVTCGCEDWEQDHHDPSTDDEKIHTVDVCPRPRPMRRGWTRQAYRDIVGSEQGKLTQRTQKAYQRYARLLDGDAYLQATMDDVTTVLLTLRLSPTDEHGRVVTAYQLTEDLFSNLPSVMDSIRYTLGQKYGFDWEYVRVVSGTEGWATPHCHLYLYVDDPNDAVYPEMFRSAVEKHVDRCSRASWESHDVEEGRTVRIEHDPPLATDGVDDEDGFGGLRDIPPTKGAVYLGAQLPHFALLGDTDPWMVDRAVTAWASPRQFFHPSRDFPTQDDVSSLKQSTEPSDN